METQEVRITKHRTWPIELMHDGIRTQCCDRETARARLTERGYRKVSEQAEDDRDIETWALQGEQSAG